MELFIGASLISSFIAGMIALFAPCCITYLLPAYLGSVFKERKHVLFMTFVFALGIFVVMFPIVLGFKFLSSLFLSFHSEMFIFGGLFMVFIGIFALLGIKLPMPSLKAPNADPEKPDVLSTYTLGVFSGITSSCCAPVLFGVLTLSILSPSIWYGGLIAFIYVLGIVTPLFALAYFVDAKNFLNAKVFKRTVTTISIFGKEYPIIMTNLLSFLVFFVMGILTIVLTFNGKLEMSEQAQHFGAWVGNLTIIINDVVGDNMFIQLLFVVAILSVFVFLYRKATK